MQLIRVALPDTGQFFVWETTDFLKFFTSSSYQKRNRKTNGCYYKQTNRVKLILIWSTIPHSCLSSPIFRNDSNTICHTMLKLRIILHIAYDLLFASRNPSSFKRSSTWSKINPFSYFQWRVWAGGAKVTRSCMRTYAKSLGRCRGNWSTRLILSSKTR